jgi:hypothetical protein
MSVLELLQSATTGFHLSAGSRANLGLGIILLLNDDDRDRLGSRFSSDHRLRNSLSDDRRGSHNGLCYLRSNLLTTTHN